jgi:hypothetical protein
MLEELQAHSGYKFKQDHKSTYGKSSYSGRGILATPIDSNKTLDDNNKLKPWWDDRVKTLRDQRKARGNVSHVKTNFNLGTSVPKLYR